MAVKCQFGFKCLDQEPRALKMALHARLPETWACPPGNQPCRETSRKLIPLNAASNQAEPMVTTALLGFFACGYKMAQGESEAIMAHPSTNEIYLLHCRHPRRRCGKAFVSRESNRINISRGAELQADFKRPGGLPRMGGRRDPMGKAP